MTRAEAIAPGGEVHVFPMRVYYEDTDAAGIVYYANYLKYAERSRTEMLRAVGLTNPGLRASADLGFIVRRCHADFREPARLDDQLEVHTRITRLGGASIEAEQRVTRAGDELVRMDVKVACVNEKGRPTRMSGPVRAALATYLRTG
jgi:acyl-CoA thioester hydrolase